MKISELIKELQKLQSENGDVEVVYCDSYGNSTCYKDSFSLTERIVNEKIVIVIEN